jgi:ABC-type lipoprotein release transport system permease subunit
MHMSRLFRLTRLISIFLSVVILFTMTAVSSTLAQEISYKDLGNNQSKLLYPEPNTDNVNMYKVDLNQYEKSVQEVQEFPKQKQFIVNRGDPDAKILEKSVQAFKDASEFLNQ